MTDELAFTGVADQAALVRSGAVFVASLVESARVRMFAAEPELHACTSILDDALTAADDADRRRVHGEELPLLGVPVVVKDSADVAGTVTSFGTAASARPAAADCEAVARLRAAGAVIVAKTTLPELAAFTHFTSSKRFGTTRNPWDPTRSSGGSSGGSAVAVAAGYVGAALASDGGGSIRVPAACCGIVGLKPQRGRIPLSPARDHWNGLGVLGPMAREVNDVALMMDVLTSPVGEHSTQFRDAAERGPSRLKIALSSRPSHSTAVSEEITGAVVDTGHLLERLGHVVEERDPDYGDVRAATVPRYLRGVVDDCAALDDPARLEARTRSLVRFGRLVSRRRLARALAFEPELVRRVNSLFDDFDVLMTPVIAQPAPPVDIWASRGAVRNLVGGIPWIAFTQVWNVTGQPALSVPAGLDRDGMPIAVQLVGRRESEAGLLRLAAAIERARPWSYPPSRTR